MLAEIRCRGLTGEQSVDQAVDLILWCSAICNEEADMKRALWTTIIIASFGIVGVAQAAGDVAAGKFISAACAACHGADGKGVAPNPPLAGRPEAEQVKALQDYKSGARANPIMKGIAASLGDKEMEDLSAYYASLK